MKLFDLVGGKVVIHEDALAIPPFRTLWELDKDKSHATNILSYIVLQNKYNSPYVKTIVDNEARSKRLKNLFFKDENYPLTVEEKIAEDEFIFLQNTATLTMLNNMRLKLDSISKYYKDSLEEELDERKIKDLLAGMTNVGKVIETIEQLEVMVKAEETVKSKRVKGDVKVNPFELPSIGVGR